PITDQAARKLLDDVRVLGIGRALRQKGAGEEAPVLRPLVVAIVLHRPPVDRDLVARPQLLEQLPLEERYTEHAGQTEDRMVGGPLDLETFPRPCPEHGVCARVEERL